MKKLIVIFFFLASAGYAQYPGWGSSGATSAGISASGLGDNNVWTGTNTFSGAVTFSSTVSVTGYITGDLDISDGTPAINFKDTGATAGDDNAIILVDATDTGDGTEDIDFSIWQQVAGTSRRTMFGDADAGWWFYPLGATTLPTSIVAGGITIGAAAGSEVRPTLTLIGDADDDAADVDETFTLTLTQHATPTSATWDFTSTQASAFTFDNDVVPKTNGAYSSGLLTNSWDNVFVDTAGVIDFNNDVTMTHAVDLMTISGGNTRVDRLEIDASTNWIDIATDMYINSAADIVLDPQGGEVGIGTTAPAEELHVQGQIMSIADVQHLTTTQTLDSTHCMGAILTNAGNADADTLTLPAAVVGYRVVVILQAAYDVDINPNSSDRILVLGSALGDAISSDATVGSMISLLATTDSTWMPMGSVGAWADVD